MMGPAGGAMIPQWFERAPAEVVARIRARSVAFGVPVMVANLVLAVLIVTLRDTPTTSYHLLHTGAVMLGGCSAFISFLCGLALAGSRPAAEGNQVNLTRLNLARRLCAGLWILTLCCTVTAWFIELMIPRTGSFGAGTTLYNLLLALPTVVGFVAARVLRDLSRSIDQLPGGSS